jgi:tetratricopeptide (TPR) repeat protein
MGIREGLMLADHIRNREARAQQERELAKIYAARAKGLEADAQLTRHNLEQALAMQQRLQQAFVQQPQAPQGPVAAPPVPLSGRGLAPEDAAQLQNFVQRYAPASDQAQLEKFSQQYGPQARTADGVNLHAGLGGSTAATLEPDEGEEMSAPEPLPSVEPAPGQADVPQQHGGDSMVLMRNLSKIYFTAGQPQIGLQIWQYADKLRTLKEASGFFTRILNDPSASETNRKAATAGLGSLLLQSGQIDAALQLLKRSLPMSTTEILERAGVDTRDELLAQMGRGEPLDIPKALAEKERKARARQETRKRPPQAKAPADSEAWLRMNLARLGYLAAGDPNDPETQRAQQALAELRALRQTGVPREPGSGGGRARPRSGRRQPVPGAPGPETFSGEAYEGRGTSPPAEPEPELPKIKSFRRVR